jgi:hypothetical protein
VPEPVTHAAVDAAAIPTKGAKMTNIHLNTGADEAPDQGRSGERAIADRASMNRRNQLICAWSGLLILLGFGVGILLAGFLPPPRADDSLQQVAQLYSDRTNRLRAGLVLMMLGGAFFAPFSAAISRQLKRIEGPAGPLAYTQLAAGAANVVVVTIGVMVMSAASFRPERNPEITQAINDLGFLLFLLYVSPLMVQTLAIGLAIVGGGDQTVFPRWVGYLNLWAAIASIPAVLLPFFKSGPFAWHGIFEFWLAATIFFTWILTMTIATIRAINREYVNPAA